MRRLVKNRKGTAEIVGVTLFLVILIFFFVNIFLWYNDATLKTNVVVGDRLNTAIRLEEIQGVPSSFPGPSINQNEELRPGMPPLGDYCSLVVNHTFATGFASDQRILLTGIVLRIHGRFEDLEGEECEVEIYDLTQGKYVRTQHTLTNTPQWVNITLSSPERYVSPDGNVSIEFRSQIESPRVNVTLDSLIGSLSIDVLELETYPYALKLTNLGGKDVQLLRIWIIEAASNNHTFVDVEALLYPTEIWLPGGTSLTIMLGDSIVLEPRRLTIPYVPTGGEVRFRALTHLGNQASVSHIFQA